MIVLFHLLHLDNSMNFNKNFDLNCVRLTSELYQQKGLSVYLIRADQIHQQVSGNKWFKLKYALDKAQQQQASSVISFGGAFSNHIHALAFAAQQLNLPAIGYIRGQWSEDNQTMRDAQRWGMNLHSLSREQYRQKNDAQFLASLKQHYPASVIIAEGGSGVDALLGVAQLMQMIEAKLTNLDCLVAACGTGGTLAGLLSSANKTKSILGIPVLKGASFLVEDINDLLLSAGSEANCQWQLDLAGHYGGYGKVKRDHLLAMRELELAHDVHLDPVYTAKMWRRFDELVSDDYFAKGSKIALLHSGGLQGRRSYALKYPELFS